eukprot:5578278-Alexandrium_andersonii.AAC.1
MNRPRHLRARHAEPIRNRQPAVMDERCVQQAIDNEVRESNEAQREHEHEGEATCKKMERRE